MTTTLDAPPLVTEPASVTGQVSGIGASVARPDGVAKVTGDFAYSSDLSTDQMLWGVTLRSPHARARILAIDVGPALAVPGVSAVLTHEDVPGRKTYGLEVADQPVLAIGEVRFIGEPVAVVAADHPETARRAAALIVVEYEELPAVIDAVAAMKQDADLVHERRPVDHPGEGNVLRHIAIRRGSESPPSHTTVTAEYQVGMQDQAFLGPESGLAVPTSEGGIELFVSTQDLHVDRQQIALSLGLALEQVTVRLAGVGGAFGGREDLSMQIHACLLSLYTRRPVKMVYSRDESFLGHVHRHPAIMRFEHSADADGRLTRVRAEIVLDGGAYSSCSSAVVSNAASFAVGPYDCDNVSIDAYVVYTNNPPCGAMRGFGSVQACFGYESQMDKLAERLGMDPVEFRIKNAMTTGSTMPTGQVVEGPAPVAELLRIVRDRPLPSGLTSESPDQSLLPGGWSNTTHGEGVRRGVGYAVGFKNNCYAEGADDFSTARVRLSVAAGVPTAEVFTSAVEVGQGLVTVLPQIVRTELGVDVVFTRPATSLLGESGSSSASRQTYCTGGAVKLAAEAVRAELLNRVAQRYRLDIDEATLADGYVTDGDGRRLLALADILDGEAVEATREFHHRRTERLSTTLDADGNTGQGDAHVQFAFAAHRVVADVDVELGLVHLVDITTAQDVGKALNPLAVRGQIHGGTAQGVGLALMEELQVVDGRIANASFTDYLIPTMLDIPSMDVEVLELADPEAPYGLRGVGEAPTVSSTPAVVSAVRAATGMPLLRVPLRPEHIVGE